NRVFAEIRIPRKVDPPSPMRGKVSRSPVVLSGVLGRTAAVGKVSTSAGAAAAYARSAHRAPGGRRSPIAPAARARRGAGAGAGRGGGGGGGGGAGRGGGGGGPRGGGATPGPALGGGAPRKGRAGRPGPRPPGKTRRYGAYACSLKMRDSSGACSTAEIVR